MGLDPLSLITGGAQGLLGIGQSIIGGIKQKKAQKDLEGYANSFQPNKSIMDYYNKSLEKYNSNPYQTQQYQQQNNQIQRNLASGLNSKVLW